jgi:DNA-cytosine methyltransferase
MNILSLFDGMSCGQIALNRAGIQYSGYFASEIEPHSIAITQNKYPDTVQLGPVEAVYARDLPKIDLLIGGSPCQGFSSAGKGLNFDDPRSKLFFEFVRLLYELKPEYFLLENVRMKKEHQDIISEYLGVQPVAINSNLVSAQNRLRLYWTNIDVAQPKDEQIFIEDILEKNVSEKYWLKERNTDLLLKKVDISNAPDIAIIDVYNKKVKLDRKCMTLSHPCHNATRLLVSGRIRKLTPIECERLQNVPDDYTKGVADTHRYTMLGNGWTINVIAHIISPLTRGIIVDQECLSA